MAHFTSIYLVHVHFARIGPLVRLIAAQQALLIEIILGIDSKSLTTPSLFFVFTFSHTTANQFCFVVLFGHDDKSITSFSLELLVGLLLSPSI